MRGSIIPSLIGCICLFVLFSSCDSGGDDGDRLDSILGTWFEILTESSFPDVTVKYAESEFCLVEDGGPDDLCLTVGFGGAEYNLTHHDLLKLEFMERAEGGYTVIATELVVASAEAVSPTAQDLDGDWTLRNGVYYLSKVDQPSLITLIEQSDGHKFTILEENTCVLLENTDDLLEISSCPDDQTDDPIDSSFSREDPRPEFLGL